MTPTTVALLVAGWACGTVLALRFRSVADHPPGPSHATASLTVVVPARNEERRLPRLLASLAAQTDPPREVIVVDDGSTDGTAQVAADAGATVITAPDPPPGWLGKPWACHLGTPDRPGPIVFLDADTWLAPDGLARLVAAHGALTPGGLLSAQPHHHVERAYEHLSLLCNVVPVLASGMFAPLRSARPRRAVAFGPCLVTDAADLRDAGGFEAVRGDLVEDVALADAFRRAGRPVRCLAGADVVAFRMYPEGVAQLLEGWTKNLARGAGRAPRVATLGTVVWVTALLAVTLEAALRPGVAALGAWALTSAQVAWMSHRVGTFRPWAAILFPIPLVAFMVLFTRSLLRRALRRPVHWRGRDVAPTRAAG